MQLKLHTCWTAFFANGLLIARAALIADHPTKKQMNLRFETLKNIALCFIEVYRRFCTDPIGNGSSSKTSAGNQVYISLFIIMRAEAETTNTLLDSSILYFFINFLPDISMINKVCA